MTQSVAYFVISTANEDQTELCAYPDGNCTIRLTRKGELVHEIPFCELEEYAVERIQDVLDQLATFIQERQTRRLTNAQASYTAADDQQVYTFQA